MTMRVNRQGAFFVFLAAIFILPICISGASSQFILSLAIKIMTLGIAAMSLDLLLGYAGLMSLGHAASVGLGAYTVAISALYGLDSIIIQLALVFVVVGLWSLISGSVSLRTSGVSFIMITLAFGQMAYFFCTSLSAYGGEDGLVLATKSQLGGVPVFQNQTSLYYVTIGCFVLIVGFCRLMVRSKFGRVLRAIHDNPERVRSLGFSPYRYQLTAYSISGILAGFAGLLLVADTEFASPAYMTWQRSGDLIIMVLIGGSGSLYGAAFGAGVYVLASEALSDFTSHWRLPFGLLLVLLSMFTRSAFKRGAKNLGGR